MLMIYILCFSIFSIGITKHMKTATLRTEEVSFHFRNNHVDSFNPYEDFKFCPNLHLNLQRLYLREPQSCATVSRMSVTSFYSRNANSILIRTEEDNREFETVSTQQSRCQSNSTFFWIAISVASVFAILIIVIIVLVIIYFKKSKKKLEVIMPEPRTYKQTQIVMQIENCGLLKTDF